MTEIELNDLRQRERRARTLASLAQFPRLQAMQLKIAGRYAAQIAEEEAKSLN